MKNFALIGAAGFIAPRHMKAIKETGNRLVAALDPSDSVGIIDGYFPEADFFTEFERFDRHLEKLRRGDRSRAVDFVSIASPNYLHDAHIRFALRVGADAVCEKPLVLNPWNLDALGAIEKELGRRIHAVLQLRHHPAIRALRDRVATGAPPGDPGASAGRLHDVDLTYITARGRWYDYSWKGDESKSGGIATNIGIHFFDMLGWVFGPVRRSVVHLKSAGRAAGFLELERARVRWLLSTDAADLPEACVRGGERTVRRLEIDGTPFDFSGGFAGLHTRVYEEILAGRGFGLEDVRPSIGIVHGIRGAAAAAPGPGEGHPALFP